MCIIIEAYECKEVVYLEPKLPYRTQGKVVSVQQFGALVELVDTHEVGILHISKISERFVPDVEAFVTPNEVILVDVVNRTPGRLELSILDIPHYRNVGGSSEAEFASLAEKLPDWVVAQKKKRRRTE